MSVELVQFMSQLLNLVMFKHLHILSLLKINTVDTEDVSFFAVFICKNDAVLSPKGMNCKGTIKYL